MYALFAISTALVSIIKIHIPGYHMYKQWCIAEGKRRTVGPIISGLVFFIISAILAPVFFVASIFDAEHQSVTYFKGMISNVS